jgi:hypothetical protein
VWPRTCPHYTRSAGLEPMRPNAVPILGFGVVWAAGTG